MKYREASNEEWDSIVSTHPGATFFHTRAWIELWEKITVRSKATCYIFENENGSSLFLPGLERKMFKGLVTRFDSGPEGTYGGFLGTDNPDAAFVNKVQTTCHHKFSFYLRQIFPENRSFYDLPPFDTTQILSLIPDKNHSSRYSKNIQRNIQKAVSNSLVIQVADSEREWEKYYDLYLQSAKRWSKSADTLYPFSFFQAIYQNNRIHHKLWLATKADQLLYGCLVFYHRDKAYYWHGCGNDQALETGASSLLHHQIMADALLHGYSSYDFMPNGGNSTLHRFKSGFGTEEKIVYGLNHKTIAYRVFEGLSHLIHGKR